MAGYINTARHAITLPNGRPVGSGEVFEYDGPLDDEPLAGSLLKLDDAPVEEPVSAEPHDRPPISPDVPGAQSRSVESSEAFDAGRMVQGPPPEKPKRKRGET